MLCSMLVGTIAVILKFSEQILKTWNLQKTCFAESKKNKQTKTRWGYSTIIPLGSYLKYKWKVASVYWAISMYVLLCCVMNSITFKLYNNAVMTLWQPHFKDKEIERWKGPNASQWEHGRTQYLPPKPQTLGHCALHLDIVLTAPNNPNHVVPFHS